MRCTRDIDVWYRVICAIAIVVLPLTAASETPLLDKRLTKGGVGLKVGLIYSSIFTLDSAGVESEFEADVGLSAAVFFDIPIYRMTAFTISGDIQDIQLFDMRQKMVDVNIGLKHSFYSHRARLALRPTITAGYAFLAEIGRLEASDYLTLKTAVELLLLRPQNPAFVLELGVFWSPQGGNQTYDVTFGPVWMLRAGVMY